MASAPDVARIRRVRRRVLGWYATRGRPLAFRATSDPWAILVSEVMAQQTQAARAAEAWSGFMAAYATPSALAQAPVAEVLRAWRGLGYNRRAVSLHRAAAMIVTEHGGRVPRELDALRRLPGVGPYTARAVAALAFGLPVGAVDTNVRRVLGRAFFGAAGPLEVDPAAMQATADQLAPRTRPGAWTHALMDLGATVCVSREPRCDACPIRPSCAWASVHPEVGVTPTRRPGASPRSASRRGGFETTSRWLRGRILDRLRDLGDGAWLAFDGPIGVHGLDAVLRALTAMARDGLLELRTANPPEARLPHG
ncbi:MAG TPA: A/G-specific adenine glycosylase [Candidatus Limnocylindrales bacterium]|nr:A/G-specific adenine glycosylase [Candidatus Limnocylindrales bacterium]